MTEIHFTIDGKACAAKPGQTIVDAAKANGVYIPVLCHYEGLKPVGSCRICTVRVAGRYMAACTQPVTEGMAVENTAPDLEDMRRSLIEMLFVEGNHLCPSCEKSGNCELQGLAYRYRMHGPRGSPISGRSGRSTPRPRCSCSTGTAASSASAASAASRPATAGRSSPRSSAAARVTIEVDKKLAAQALRRGGPPGHGHLPGRRHPDGRRRASPCPSASASSTTRRSAATSRKGRGR